MGNCGNCCGKPDANEIFTEKNTKRSNVTNKDGKDHYNLNVHIIQMEKLKRLIQKKEDSSLERKLAH